MPTEFELARRHVHQLVVGRIRERGSRELCDSACRPRKSARPLAF